MGEEVALREVRVPLVVNVVTPEEAAAADPAHAFTEEVLILRTARIRDEARDLAGRGDTGASLALLAEGSKLLRERAANSSRAEELVTEADSLDRAARWIGDADPMRPPPPAAFKAMHYDSYSTRRRRRGGGGPKGA